MVWSGAKVLAGMKGWGVGFPDELLWGCEKQEDAREVKRLIEYAYKKGRHDMANEIQQTLEANKPPKDNGAS